MSRFAALVLLLACTSADAERQASEPRTVAQPERRFIDPGLPPATIDAFPAAGRAAAMDARLRPRPDRRFLMAVTDVHEILTGVSVEPEILFTEGVWRVKAGDRDLGTLPEVPRFGDALAMLTKLAADLGVGEAKTLLDASAFYATPLFESARDRDPAELARAGAFLSLQTIDRFGLADPLHARSLALLAIARASAGSQTEETASLLATSFDYEIEGSTKHRLSPAARAYLDARQALRDGSDNQEELMASLPARALPIFVADGEMHETMSRGLAAARVIAADVTGDRRFAGVTAERAQADGDEDPGRLLSQFEHALEKRSETLASRGFPAETVRAHFEALFYSAYYDIFHMLTERYGSQEDAESFVKSLGQPTKPAGKQVRDWFEANLAARYQRGGDSTPAQVLARVPLTGGAAQAELLSRYDRALGSWNQSMRRAGFALFPRLDTRPSELLHAARVADDILSDPLRSRRYYGVVVERAPGLVNAGTRGWLYGRVGDEPRLREMAESAAVQVWDRASALRAIGRIPGADKNYVTTRLEQLVTAVDWDVYPEFMSWIDDQRDWKTKERVARQWLRQYAKNEESPITVGYYAASLAHALEEQGRYDEAWAILEPHVPVWSAYVIERAVSILDRRGHTNEALELGEQYVRRYPGVDSRTTVAGVLWRRKRHVEAAELFSASHRLNAGELSRYLPSAFLSAFREASPREAVAAIDALMRGGLQSWVISAIVSGAGNDQKHELALAMVEQLSTHKEWKATTPEGASAIIYGWRAVAATKGMDAAAEWIAARVGDDAASQFVAIAYQNEEYELVLQYATPRTDLLKNVEMLSYIAASLTHMRAPLDDPRRSALIEQVRAQGDQPKSLLPVAQYLLGMTDEASFLQWPYMQEGGAVAAYFVGLKAAASGDYDRALPWLLAAGQGGDTNPAAAWAIGILRRWNAAQMTWAGIKQSGLL